MSKTKIILLLAFVLAIGAGVAVGVLSARTLPAAAPQRDSWLAQELELTAEQQDSMQSIWNDLLRNRGREYAEQWKNLQQERDVAMRGLLSSDQKQAADRIDQQFAEKARLLWKQAEAEFTAASAKSRQMLNESQKVKYDALLTRFKSQRGNGDWFGPGAAGKPATMPADVK